MRWISEFYCKEDHIEDSKFKAQTALLSKGVKPDTINIEVVQGLLLVNGLFMPLYDGDDYRVIVSGVDQNGEYGEARI